MSCLPALTKIPDTTSSPHWLDGRQRNNIIGEAGGERREARQRNILWCRPDDNKDLSHCVLMVSNSPGNIPIAASQ